MEMKSAAALGSLKLAPESCGYGPVFKATPDHTFIVIKVLRSDSSQGQRQFCKEVEDLSNRRHPNMLIVLGVCSGYGCLMYEYMKKAAWEIASLGKAKLFLFHGENVLA
ncbi:hypothetical protein SADUNF_Sadunf03G0022300 [Salix dunnii]|uniref:RING-type E3 ubiquitin transferase n=1 Tax=Salix dunnii TaxID=1413687 RepID=A0A835N1H3_9ROSI|nr:hypothetical protein SADUNF_Sadunf03G0022300 [Salix dunnii]